MEWLKDGYQFVVLYHNEPDSFAHQWGPNSVQNIQRLSWLDDQFGSFFAMLSRNKVYDTVIYSKYLEQINI